MLKFMKDCFKEVSKWFQGYFNEVHRIFQGSFKEGVQRELSGSFNKMFKQAQLGAPHSEIQVELD